MFLITFSKAQGDMRFLGAATKDGSPLSGATVAVVMDGKQIFNLKTGKNGKFKFIIDLGHLYRINFYSAGCVEMFMDMDLRTPTEKAWVFPDYSVEVPFFVSGDSKVKTELFRAKPFIKIIFDGDNGFHDDPSYHFVEEILKSPKEEQKKKEVIAKKEDEEKARIAAEAIARKAEEERQRIAEASKKKIGLQKVTEILDPSSSMNNGMESDAISLERKKQEKQESDKQNKNIRATYQNNLIKLIASSERQSNLKKFNRMKEDAQANSVIQALRSAALIKAENSFLIAKMKERKRQTLVNKYIKEQLLKELIESASTIERDALAVAMKPIIYLQNLNYTPSPNIVVTVCDNYIVKTIANVISWPNGTRTVFNIDEYFWGIRYYYQDGVEIDQKNYDSELFKHKRS